MRCRVIGVLCKAAGSKGDSHSSSMERLSHLQAYFTIIMPLLSVNVPILYPHFAGEKMQAQRGKVVCPEAHSQNGKSRVSCLPVGLQNHCWQHLCSGCYTSCWLSQGGRMSGEGLDKLDVSRWH